MKTAGAGGTRRSRWASPDVPAVSPPLSGAAGYPPMATQKDIQTVLFGGIRAMFFLGGLGYSSNTSTACLAMH